MKVSHISQLLSAAAMAALLPQAAAEKAVRIMTLEPGHFHAALVQKSMYEQVDPVVNVYSTEGPDLDLHLARIESFNSRDENPTSWQTKVHKTDDPVALMIEEKPGNLVVISGKNAGKAGYILRCVEAGLNVLSDKPMVTTPAELEQLKKAFAVAKEKGVLLSDIMTERHEITTMMQRELAHMPALFGKLVPGTKDEPAVTKESVHHYSKLVAGKQLKRSWWFFDVAQQGEGIVDVTTHLVDLIQWECFPGATIKPEDVEVVSARVWTTKLSPEQFEKVTGLKEYPEGLKSAVNADGELEVRCNGEFTYKLRGIHCKASVIWNYEAPKGTGDTHYSIMRGSKANLVIRQGKEEGFKPTLYVEPVGDASIDDSIKAAVGALAKKWPGVAPEKSAKGWKVVIPDKYKVGHEAHFAQVTKAYLECLKSGKLPAWEVPNMLMKHETIMEAYRMSR